jgi:branched-chain amino acid transport system permease protein
VSAAVRAHAGRAGAWLVLVVVVLALPSVLSPEWMTVAVQALLLSIGTLGLTLLAGYGGQFSIASSGLLAAGAGVLAALSVKGGLPPLVGIAGAVVAGAVIGLLVGLPALRLRGLYLLLATLAAHYILLYGWRQYLNHSYTATGILYDPLQILGVKFTTDRSWLFLLAPVVAVIGIFVANVKHTGVGRSLFALNQNEVAAAASGIDVARLKLVTFVVSSALTALGGALYGLYYQSLTAEYFTLQMAVNYYVALIVGGRYFAGGAVVGATFVAAGPVALTDLSSSVGGGWLSDHAGEATNFLFGLVIIVVLITRPDGLWGLVDAGRRRLRAAVRRNPGAGPPGPPAVAGAPGEREPEHV